MHTMHIPELSQILPHTLQVWEGHPMARLCGSNQTWIEFYKSMGWVQL